MKAAAVEKTLFGRNACGEEAGENGTQGAADTMDRDRTDRIINFGDLIKEFNSQNDHNPKYNTHDGRAQRRNRITAGGNANETGKGSVISHGYIRLTIAEPSENQCHTAGNSSAEVGVEEY